MTATSYEVSQYSGRTFTVATFDKALSLANDIITATRTPVASVSIVRVAGACRRTVAGLLRVDGVVENVECA